MNCRTCIWVVIAAIIKNKFVCKTIKITVFLKTPRMNHMRRIENEND